jgi:hypothetical protein
MTPFAPPDYQGDYIAFDGTRLYQPVPWWLGYSAPRSDVVASAPQVEVASVAPPLPGGWTSAFGYISPENWPR